MRKFVLPLMIVASLGASSMAMAATTPTQNAQGVVKAIDAKTMMLTLADGSVYKLPAKFKVADIKAGAKVKVTWEKTGKVNDATAVSVVK